MSGFNITSRDIDVSKFTSENFAGLKSRFPDSDDETIARYLIARNNDLQKATDLLTKATAWRSRRMPVLKEEFAEEFAQGKAYVRGTDKEGRPLLIVHSAKHDPGNRDIEKCAKMSMWLMEHAIKQLPPDKSKYTILLDRTGSAAMGDIEFSRHFSKLFQDQHPERLHKAIVYPSGIVFWSLFNIVKWFFDPVTRNKISPVVYLAGVQEFIAEEHIPASMGGKSTYVFNPDDYPDPFPADVIEATRTRKATIAPSGKTFFQPEEDADVGSYDSP
ncbi:hypothetical protein EON65_11905 [archaeon]|nr:MAG: hypothetical protein EON65_11905 [archaeon]